jgi:PAS domain-containing protein
MIKRAAAAIERHESRDEVATLIHRLREDDYQTVAAVVRELAARVTRPSRLAAIHEGFYSSTTGHWWLDFDTQDTWQDAAQNRLMGRADDHDISGHVEPVFYDLVHPADLPRIRDAVERTARTGVAYDETFRFYKPDGTILTLHDRGHLIAEGGRRLCGVCLDITGRATSVAVADQVATAPRGRVLYLPDR